MAVAFNSTTGEIVSGASVTSLTINTMTVGSGANRNMIVILHDLGALVSGMSVTWDSGGSNQALSLIQSRTNGTQQIQQWGWDPAGGTLVSGNKTLLISWTGTTQMIAAAMDVTGVDSSSFANAFNNTGADFFGSTGATVTSTVTSAIGDMPIACFDSSSSLITLTSPTQTEFANGQGSVGTMEDQYAAGAASVSFSITPSGTSTMFGASFNIHAAAAAGSPPSGNLSMMGVG